MARGLRQRGFSLIESLLAAAILAVAAAALLLPFTIGAANNTLVVDQAASVNLAEALLEEILAKPFYDPDSSTRRGPEPGEAGRIAFDNMDDYDGYSESAGQLKDAAGAAITDPSLAPFSRSVAVGYVYLPNQDASQPPTTVRIIVEVRAGGMLVHKLTRLAGRRNETPVAGEIIP